MKLGYYSQSNQLYSINEQKIPHDEVGNLLKDDKGQGYHYNEAGKLIKVTKGENTIAEYVYNAFSQRVSKKTTQGVTYFSYDLNGQLIQESGQTKIGYLWLDGQPIAQLGTANSPTYLVSDHLNTPRIGLDKHKKIVWQWESDAFGSKLAIGSINVASRFPGQYVDSETGLFYNWHRYYNPTTGRYITSDPIGLNAGINTYAYVGGNPVNSYDLMGLAWSNEDSVNHYISYSGRTVTLREIGHLESIRQSIAYLNAFGRFVDQLHARAESVVLNNGVMNLYFYDYFSNPLDLIDVFPRDYDLNVGGGSI